MSQTIELENRIKSTSIPYSITEFMDSGKLNIVDSSSSLFYNECFNRPKLKYKYNDSCAELLIIDSADERILFVQDDDSLIEQYTDIKKVEKLVKHHIAVSQVHQTRMYNLIGMYCNGMKQGETFNSKWFAPYKSLELLLCTLFDVDMRVTKVITTYSYYPVSVEHEYTEVLLNLCNIDTYNIYTYSLNVKLIERQCDNSFNVLMIEYSGHIDEVLIGLTNFIIDCGVELKFSEVNKTIINNKILEIKIK